MCYSGYRSFFPFFPNLTPSSLSHSTCPSKFLRENDPEARSPSFCIWRQNVLAWLYYCSSIFQCFSLSECCKILFAMPDPVKPTGVTMIYSNPFGMHATLAKSQVYKENACVSCMDILHVCSSFYLEGSTGIPREFDYICSLKKLLKESLILQVYL